MPNGKTKKEIYIYNYKKATTGKTGDNTRCVYLPRQKGSYEARNEPSEIHSTLHTLIDS